MNKYLRKSMDKIVKTLGVTIHEFKGKTILITGANGLIGGFLSDFFVYLNDEHDFNCQLVLTSLSSEPKRLRDLRYRNDVSYYSKDLMMLGFLRKLIFVFIVPVMHNQINFYQMLKRLIG